MIPKRLLVILYSGIYQHLAFINLHIFYKLPNPGDPIAATLTNIN